jgi:hypothetical protein
MSHEIPDSWREAIDAAVSAAPPLPDTAIALLRAAGCPTAKAPVAP